MCAISIKETKRKLFHSSVYESEAQLKRLYVQTCQRLPAFNCHLFNVREIVNMHTKKKVSYLAIINPPSYIWDLVTISYAVVHTTTIEGRSFFITRDRIITTMTQWLLQSVLVNLSYNVGLGYPRL